MTDNETNDNTEEEGGELALQLVDAEDESVSIVDLNAPLGSHAAFVAALAIVLRDHSDA